MGIVIIVAVTTAGSRAEGVPFFTEIMINKKKSRIHEAAMPPCPVTSLFFFQPVFFQSRYYIIYHDNYWGRRRKMDHLPLLSLGPVCRLTTTNLATLSIYLSFYSATISSSVASANPYTFHIYPASKSSLQSSFTPTTPFTWYTALVCITQQHQSLLLSLPGSTDTLCNSPIQGRP
jgi:hypothetical protein